MIDKGVNVDVQNNYQETALMDALRKENYKLARILINSNCDLNISNMNGKTPLHIASKKSNKIEIIEIIELLLKNNANVLLKDCYGNYPISYLSNDSLIKKIRKKMVSNDMILQNIAHKTTDINPNSIKLRKDYSDSLYNFRNKNKYEIAIKNSSEENLVVENLVLQSSLKQTNIIKFNSDATMFACADENTILIYNVYTRNVIARIKSKQEYKILSLSFSPDSKFLLVAGRNFIDIFDINKEKIHSSIHGQSPAFFDISGKHIIGCALNPSRNESLEKLYQDYYNLKISDGEYLNKKRNIKDELGVGVWDFTTNKLVKIFEDKNASRISALCISPSGSEVAAAYDFKYIKHYNIKTKTIIDSYPTESFYKGQEVYFVSIGYSKDEKYLFFESNLYDHLRLNLKSGKVVSKGVLDMKNTISLNSRYTGGHGYVKGVLFDKNYQKNLILTCKRNNTLALHKLSNDPDYSILRDYGDAEKPKNNTINKNLISQTTLNTITHTNNGSQLLIGGSESKKPILYFFDFSKNIFNTSYNFLSEDYDAGKIQKIITSDDNRHILNANRNPKNWV